MIEFTFVKGIIYVHSDTVPFTLTLTITYRYSDANITSYRHAWILVPTKDKAENIAEDGGRRSRRGINIYMIICCLIFQPLWNTTSWIQVNTLISTILKMIITAIFNMILTWSRQNVVCKFHHVDLRLQPNSDQSMFIQVQAIQ